VLSERTKESHSNSGDDLCAALTGAAAVNHNSDSGSERTWARLRMGRLARDGLGRVKMRSSLFHREAAAGEVVQTVRICAVVI